MERFADGAHVRLRSRIDSAYLFADEDGYGVSMSPHGASLNAVWAVHRLVRSGTSYVLLHGAAYGRYLCITREDAPRGHGRVIQRVYDDPERRDVLWEPFEAEDGSGGVVMRNRRYGPWRRFEHPDEEISWMVEANPPRQDPPELPPAVPPPMVPLGGTMLGRHRLVPQPVSRSIQYGRAADQEGFNPLVWSTLWFDGQSVFNLRREIARALGEHDELNIALCVRGGSQGRLTPLVTDLPDDEQTMEIVVFTPGSQAAAELVYPDVDAEQDVGCQSRAPTSKSISLPHAQEDSQSRWVEDSDSDEDEEYSNFTDEKSRDHICLGCHQDAGASLCDKCTDRLKMPLIEARKHALGTGTFRYCLECRRLTQGDHGEHKSACIPLDIFDGSQVAWVTKKERWSGIFAGVQSDCFWNRFTGRPFLLHSRQGSHCVICGDILSKGELYGPLLRFCTVECWAESAGKSSEYEWVKALVNADFDGPGAPSDAFCITCQCPFSIAEDGAEHRHEKEPLHVITYFLGGTAATKVEISSDHFMAGPWKTIKDLAGGETMCSQHRLFRLRDEGAKRCRCCNIRLENGGGQTCSLDCALPDILMVPRPVRIQVKPHGQAPAAEKRMTHDREIREKDF